MQQLREQEKRLCLQDPVYFCENYCHIEDKDAPELIVPFTLWDGQKDALRKFATERRVCVLKARQLGFTWLALAEAARLVVFRSGRTVVGLSRSENEARELVRRLAVMLRYMPEFVCEDKPPPGWTGPWFEAKTLELTVHFPDAEESKFQAFASNPNVARSFTADLIILDEWAFQPDADKIWQSAYPIVNRPTGGRVIGLSTIKLGTTFEEIYTTPGNGFCKVFLPWSTDPRRDETWYAQTVAALGEAKTLQEYPATEEEALGSPSGRFFKELCEKHRGRPPAGNVVRYVCIDYGLDMLSAHWVAIGEDGHAVVYRELDEPNLNIGAAADAVLRASGDERIQNYLAPGDLWNREQVQGKSRALLFGEAGLNLTESSRDLAAGCAAIKQWLSIDEETGTPWLTIHNCPQLWSDLSKIQVDEKNPDVYAKTPHKYTHSVDSLRYFCIWWALRAKPKKKMTSRKWTADMWEDYRNASREERKLLRQRYGEPA